MNYYAIGKKNKEIRMFVQSDNIERVKLQLAYGEVYVEVLAPLEGKISSNGKSVIPAGINMYVEMSKVRERRTALLAASDWTMFSDSPLSPEQKAEWSDYRQALRDITEEQPGLTVDQIVWPESPSS